MRKLIKYLTPLIPALVLFGPLFMVIGCTPLSHMLASIGALMTGLGILIVYITIVDHSKRIKELSEQLEEKKE